MKSLEDLDWCLLSNQKQGLLEVIAELDEDLKYDVLTEENDQYHIDCLKGIADFLNELQSIVTSDDTVTNYWDDVWSEDGGQ